MSLVVEFVAAAADVGAAFVVVVAAVAACIETFVAVVLGPSSLFPSLLSLSQRCVKASLAFKEAHNSF